MRLAVALVAMLSLLSGCFGNNDGDDRPEVVAPPPLTQQDITVPTGAVLETVEGGFVALWEAAQLPFVVEVVVPEHATMIRAVALDETATSVSMMNVETLRRRCNNPTVESFSRGFQAPRS